MTLDKNISYLGDVITYQLAVKNTGNVPANQVVITDIIANGLSYVPNSVLVSVPYSGTPSTGITLTGITLTGPIAPGQSVNISFQAKVNTMPLPNPIENIASASLIQLILMLSQQLPQVMQCQRSSSVMTIISRLMI